MRDLCQIGEYLKNKGVGRGERVERVKKEFRAGEIVQHREIRELLSRVKKNEFEERLKGMMKKEPGMEEEEEEQAKMMITTTSNNARDGSVFGTPAITFTNKETYVNAFMPDAQAAIQRMQGSEEVEEVKYADTPGFATAEQIRASFSSRSRKRNLSPLKRKRDVVVIKEEPVSAESTSGFDYDGDNQVLDTTPKRNRFAAKNPLTPHSARQIAQGNNTAPAKLAAWKMGTGEKMVGMGGDESAGRLREVVDLVHHLDIMIGNAQKKLRDDVGGAETLLAAAKNLIGATMNERASKKEVEPALMEEASPAFRASVGLTFRKSAGRTFRDEAMYRDSSEDGV